MKSRTCTKYIELHFDGVYDLLVVQILEKNGKLNYQLHVIRSFRFCVAFEA